MNRVSQALSEIPDDLKARLEDGQVTLMKLAIDFQELATIHSLQFDQVKVAECLRESERYRDIANEIGLMLAALRGES